MKEKILLSYTHGITNSPSDTLCGDGELAECVNLELKNQELVPMEMPVKLGFTLDSGEKLVLVHNIKTGGKNYFTLSSSGVLKAFKVVGGSKVSLGLSVSCGTITSIQSIGNTVVVYTPDSPHYILYKDNSYTYLGSSIPEISISFGLSGEFAVGEAFEISTPDADKNSDDYQSAVVPSLVAEANKFISEKATSVDKFMFPFFVRYAVRLFDGSCIRQSSPILMLPSTYQNPYCVCVRGTRDVDMKGKTYKCQIGGMVSSLEYEILNTGTDLSKWSDIITGVDICVSSQISTYDQNGTKFGTSAAMSQFVGRYEGLSSIWNINSILEKKSTLEVGEQQYLSQLYLPVRELDEIYGDIKNTSLFYKVSFIDSSDIYTGSTNSVTGSLNSVEVGETLKDDYMTHDDFIPKSSFVYNSRLNISNVDRIFFDGFRVDSMTQMFTSSPSDGYNYMNLEYGSFYAYVYIRNSNGGSDIVVKSPLSSYGGLYAPYFFYPDTDAYQMVISNSSGSRIALVNLSEHTGLNGAYSFTGFSPLLFINGNGNISTTNNVEHLPNKLFTSELNNPFYFPLEGIYTVGSGEIIGMTAVTRPISQGQFGEFPMMMFCSDGNYAMKVDAEGFYERISPIQEDIVLGNDKITPMEDSVVVITKKGLMLNQGGEMVKLAPQMDGGVFDKSKLEGISTSNANIANLCNFSSDTEGFLSYLYDARMAFDYSSNRLFIYNTSKTYSYVYNFENSTVSKMILDGGAKVVASVIDYPDTIIQDENGGLYSLYAKDDVSVMDGHLNGFALTRPMKFGGAMTMKSIYQIKNLDSVMSDGSFVKYSIYGSNDNTHYYKVASRYGKPYKYYRLAIYTNMLPKESFTGTAITIEERRTGKLR